MNTKYKMNESYFQKIDSEDKAYFLGLMYADGNLYYRKGKSYESYACVIDLNYSDGYILQKMSRFIFCGIDRTKEKITKERKHVLLTFGRKKIFQDLERLGCTPRKTFTIRFPDINLLPAHLIHHFIRGYFDGDGCITMSIDKKYKNIKGNLNIVSNRAFCEDLQYSISTALNIYVGITDFKHSPGISKIQFSNLKSIHEFYKYIYKDASLFLERKKNKFEEFFKLRSSFVDKRYNNSPEFWRNNKI